MCDVCKNYNTYLTWKWERGGERLLHCGRSGASRPQTEGSGMHVSRTHEQWKLETELVLFSVIIVFMRITAVNAYQQPGEKCFFPYITLLLKRKSKTKGKKFLFDYFIMMPTILTLIYWNTIGSLSTLIKSIFITPNYHKILFSLQSVGQCKFVSSVSFRGSACQPLSSF